MLQGIWHQINNGPEVYVVGQILDDQTVKGGTGWGAEFAKLCNKPLFVFDQNEAKWFRWSAQPGDGRKRPEWKDGSRRLGELVPARMSTDTATNKVLRAHSGSPSLG